MMTQEEFMDVVALHRQGFTITDIAAKVGRHPQTVSRWLKQGGPPARRPVADTVLDARWAARLAPLLGRTPNLRPGPLPGPHPHPAGLFGGPDPDR